jgi:hypothetical protein
MMKGLAQQPGASADSSALDAEPSVLAQAFGTDDLAAPAGAEQRRAHCPGLYTAL